MKYLFYISVSSLFVKSVDRNFLLKIRNGEFEFDEMMQMVEEKMEQIKVVYAKSSLPDKQMLIKSSNF